MIIPQIASKKSQDFDQFLTNAIRVRIDQSEIHLTETPGSPADPQTVKAGTDHPVPVQRVFRFRKVDHTVLTAVQRHVSVFRDLYGFASACGLTVSQAAFALAVLRDIDLIDASLSPFRVSLRPMQKRDPAESRLFQLARQTHLNASR